MLKKKILKWQIAGGGRFGDFCAVWFSITKFFSKKP